MTNAIYDRILYDEALYGEYEEDNLLRWAIEVDWDGDGVFDGSNEAKWVTYLRTERGRDNYVDFQANGIVFPSVGKATVILDNSERRYDPRNVSGPLYGYLDSGKLFRIGVMYQEIFYEVFTGIISDLRPTGGGSKEVRLSAEDGLAWFNDKSTYIQVQTALRLDEAIDLVLDEVAWPWSRDLDISTDFLSFWWADDSAAGEISKLMQSGLGYFATMADGAARFIRRNTVTVDGIELNDENTLNDPELGLPLDTYRNIVRVAYYPLVQKNTGTIWEDTTTLEIPAGETRTIWCDYTYNDSPTPAVNVVNPVATTDFLMNAADDGSGTNLTGSCSVTLTNFGKKGKLVITNSSGSLGYMVLLKIRGDAIVVDYPAAVEEQRADYATQPRSFKLELPLQQDAGAARSIAVAFADFLETRNTWPTVQVDQRPEIQFVPDLFETLRYNSAFLAVDDSFRVGKIIHEARGTLQSVRTTFKLEPYITGSLAWEFDITDFGTDTIFG